MIKRCIICDKEFDTKNRGNSTAITCSGECCKKREKLYHREYARKPEVKERRKQYEQKPEIKERRKHSCREWRAKNPLKEVLIHAKRRANRANIPFNLTIEYLQIIAIPRCPVFGWEWESGSWAAMTLDRVDSSKGYTVGNVRFLSKLANTMKLHATDRELIMFAEWVLRERGLELVVT